MKKLIIITIAIFLSSNAHSIGGDGTNNQYTQVCNVIKIGGDGTNNKIGGDGTNNKVGGDGTNNKVGQDGSGNKSICHIILIEQTRNDFFNRNFNFFK